MLTVWSNSALHIQNTTAKQPKQKANIFKATSEVYNFRDTIFTQKEKNKFEKQNRNRVLNNLTHYGYCIVILLQSPLSPHFFRFILNKKGKNCWFFILVYDRFSSSIEQEQWLQQWLRPTILQLLVQSTCQLVIVSVLLLLRRWSCWINCKWWYSVWLLVRFWSCEWCVDCVLSFYVRFPVQCKEAISSCCRTDLSLITVGIYNWPWLTSETQGTPLGNLANCYD
jgi:hypothetical protein